METTYSEEPLKEEFTVGDPVEEEEAEPEKAPLFYLDTEPNLAPIFDSVEEGKKAAKEIVDKVIKDKDSAWEGAEEFRERVADDWKMFTCELPPREDNPDMANAHIPSMLENVSRVYLRTYSEIFGNFKSVFNVMPIGREPAAVEKARILTLHGNWQLRTQIIDFQRQMHRLVLGYFVIGDICVHSYYDDYCKTNRHEVLTPDQFVIPYTYTTTAPDYSDCPFRVRIYDRYRHEMEQMRDAWHGVDKVLDEVEPSFEDEPEQPLAESVAQAQGIEKPSKDDLRAPYKLLWYEGWLKLPNQEKERFCKAIVEPSSRTLLLLAIHEQEDWQDRYRFERQTAELQQYQLLQSQRAQSMEQATMLGEAGSALENNGMIGPEMRAYGEAAFQAQIPPEPMTPGWMKGNPLAKPEPTRRKPVHLFTHITCIEPFVGNLGIGYGRIQSDLNRAEDVLLTQYVDSASLANLGMYLAAEGIEFVDGFKMKPGKVQKVKGVGAGEIEKKFMQLKFAPANPQLADLVDRLLQQGQSSMQSPNVLSGESGKSGETKGGIMARIDQASKQISVMASKVADGVKHITKKNAQLNAIFLEDEEIIQITDDPSAPPTITVGRHLYESDYNVEIVSDLRFTSEAQKIMEADEALKLCMDTAQVHMSRELVLAAIVKSFEARRRNDLADLLKQVVAQQQQAAAQAQAQAAAAQAAGQQPQQGQSPQGQPQQRPQAPQGPPRPMSAPRPQRPQGPPQDRPS